jgi:sugar diacid utilization regulator
MRDSDDVTTIELKVADAAVGVLRMRARDQVPEAVLRLLSTLIASEMERTRAPERASEEAARSFAQSLLAGEVPDGANALARARELGLDLATGACVAVVRAHPRNPAEDDWRARLMTISLRGARSVASGAIGYPSPAGSDDVTILVPGADGELARRICATVIRELESGLPGFALALGCSRHAGEPLELRRAADEALLAANVVQGDPDRSALPFEDTGTYQLLLPHMRDPAELRRFYEQTVRPLVLYDEQYETDLVGTLATFLDCDANVNATAARLFTHRHTIRYRFERVRELTGLDVSSSDGREKLSLGLKAMRVLGIAPPRGPATEPGAEGGRVPR